MIPAFAVVTILAPNTLSISPANMITTEFQVPALNLTAKPAMCSQYRFGRDDEVNGIMAVLNVEATTASTQTFQKAMISPETVLFSAPPTCGISCSYNFTIQGPALECIDEQDAQETIIAVPLRTEWYYSRSIYNSSISLFDQAGDWTLNLTYLDYNSTESMNHVETGGTWTTTRHRTFCRFRAADYAINVTMVNNTQFINATIVQYGRHLSRQF